MEVIDPNSFSKDTLVCQVESLYKQSLSGTNSRVGTICHSSKISKDWTNAVTVTGKVLDIFVMMNDDLVSAVDPVTNRLIENRQKICQANPNLALCKKTPVERLADDYPQIENTGDASNPRGFCKGWSLFSLKVAYFGDFVGECHPVAIKSPTQNFLANLSATAIAPFSGLVDFSRTLFDWSLSFFK